LPEKPNGKSIPLHYGSYVCTRSYIRFTPQAAGNTTPRDLIVNSRSVNDQNIKTSDFSYENLFMLFMLLKDFSAFF